MTLLDALQWRYAVKQFSDKQVSEEELKQLLNATRLSASSYGIQPYKLIVVKSNELKQQLVSYSYGQDKVANCSHLIVFAADRHVGDQMVDRYMTKHAEVHQVSIEDLSRYSDHVKSDLGSKTEEQKQQWAHQQAYIALGNFLTCAAAMGIDTCPMTGFDNSGFDRILGLKAKGLTSTVISPIGFRHSEDQRAFEPKVRFDYDEFVTEV